MHGICINDCLILPLLLTADSLFFPSTRARERVKGKKRDPGDEVAIPGFPEHSFNHSLSY